MSFEIIVDNPITEERKTVKVTLEELNDLIKDKKILRVVARHGLLEIHFEHIVFTVDPKHISFIEVIKWDDKKWNGYFWKKV